MEIYLDSKETITRPGNGDLMENELYGVSSHDVFEQLDKAKGISWILDQIDVSIVQDHFDLIPRENREDV